MTTAEQLHVFLREIKDRPDDDTPRLVLADWLQDAGDVRGEFIHLQVTRARLSPDDPRGEQLLRREREILRRRVFAWLGPFIDVCASWEFVRGFLWLKARAERLLRGWKAASSGPWDWIEGLKVTDLHMGDLGSLARVVVVKDFTDLDLSGSLLGDLRPLLIGSTRKLRSLSLRGTHLRYRQVALLGDCPHLAGLCSLDLSGNQLRDDAAIALVESPHLRNLSSLDMRDNPLGAEGAAALRAAFGPRVLIGRRDP